MWCALTASVERQAEDTVGGGTAGVVSNVDSTVQESRGAHGPQDGGVKGQGQGGAAARLTCLAAMVGVGQAAVQLWSGCGWAVPLIREDRYALTSTVAAAAAGPHVPTRMAVAHCRLPPPLWRAHTSPPHHLLVPFPPRPSTHHRPRVTKQGGERDDNADDSNDELDDGKGGAVGAKRARTEPSQAEGAAGKKRPRDAQDKVGAVVNAHVMWPHPARSAGALKWRDQDFARLPLATRTCPHACAGGVLERKGGLEQDELHARQLGLLHLQLDWKSSLQSGSDLVHTFLCRWVEREG
eukprot:352223-Chlamydomonas_euryale.AAC.2